MGVPGDVPILSIEGPVIALYKGSSRLGIQGPRSMGHFLYETVLGPRIAQNRLWQYRTSLLLPRKHPYTALVVDDA